MLDCLIVGWTSVFIFIAFNPSLQQLLPYIHICYHGLLFTTVWCGSLGSEIDNIQYTIPRNENFFGIFIFWLNCHRIPVIPVQCVVLWFIGGRKKSSSDGSDQLNTVRRGTCFRSTNLYSSTILPPPLWPLVENFNSLNWFLTGCIITIVRMNPNRETCSWVTTSPRPPILVFCQFQKN